MAKIELRQTSDGKQVWYAYSNYWPSVPTAIKDNGAVRLAIELEAFRVALTVEEGGLGKAKHLQNIAEWIFPTFEWHRWAIRTIQALCTHRYVGLAGSGKSGKSDIMAVYGLISWMADPVNTKVFVLSTSKTDAKGRIWGHFCNRYNELERGGLKEFKNMGRECQITFKNPRVGKGDASAITLVAAGDADRDNAVERLQGQNNTNIIILADEFQDCSNSVFDAAINLKLNPNFQFICSGNAASPLDPHGLFCTPEIGWNGVTADMKEWPTLLPDGEKGMCLRFDGKDSPNFDDYEETGVNRYPYLIRVESVLQAEISMGEKDSRYWRQIRGYWPPGGMEDDVIYPVADLNKHKAMERNIQWQSTPLRAMGFDPAYTNDGDRAIAYLLELGMANRGTRDEPIIRQTIYFKEWKEIKVEDSTEDASRDYNMIEQAKKIAIGWNVLPENVAVDGSSANPIRGIIAKEWSPQVMIVNFGGAPSDMPYRKDDPRKCKDVFFNKVSELWYIGREFLINGQLAGITTAHAKEMSIRKFEMSGKKTKVESKKDMRKRTNGVSPDLCDAGFLGIHLFRERHRLIPGADRQPVGVFTKLFGPSQKVVDKPNPYEFKSLQTMQRTSSKPDSKSGSMDSILKLGRR